MEEEKRPREGKEEEAVGMEEEKRPREGKEEEAVGEASLKSRRVGDIEDCHLGHAFGGAEEIAAVSGKLVEWYGRVARTLPWRKTIEGESAQQRAYRVWVSEVMLQQTQVSVVVGFFERFLARWPTLQALAAATNDEVMAVWSGLGFYRRGKFLLEGAQQVVREMGGVIPTTSKELQKLRGVGEYTSGAIASIAFGEKAPIVDGNVIRVVSRLRAIGGSPKAKLAVKKHWELAGQLVQVSSDPSKLNQALMELGATVCTKQKPKCGECPVRAHCWAVAPQLPWKETTTANGCIICGDWQPEPGQKGPERFPAKKPKVKKSDMAALMLVICVEDKFVLVQRPATGLLAGLREFPTVEFMDRNTLPAKAVQASARAALLAKCFANPVSIGDAESLGHFDHKFSHIDERVFVQIARVAPPVELQPGVTMVTREEVAKSGVCKSTNKALAMIDKNK
jgi:A/G-specific adenine glycosylase